MITTLLIANRGEIACRIARTCRRLGIRTVAVHSDADADALHVRSCDVAVHLPGNSPTDTYLRIDLLVDAARRSGATAVHPGYGFLAENAQFAHAVIDAGLVWVGPPPAAIAAMGSKIEAKQRMREAGVPVLPDSSSHAIDQIGYPMLVKASAGGGGRGMRIVRDPNELDEACTSAEREAAAAFGDGTVFCERYVERGRHIEIQVFADTHGTVTSLHERECSIQRRHQKIVEEAPSPAVDQDLRARMCAAAETAAREVGYEGAGTVEFLLDEHGAFWFLEMNTRLQVEHPVTESITGLDLVELQLLVAEGQPLPPRAIDPPITGHAIEVRLTAEDPSAGYAPSTGIFHRIDVGTDVRIDTGVTAGSVVTPYYDSMVAKIIAHGPDRATAVRSLRGALRQARIHGPTTNREQLMAILEHPEFTAGRLHTEFLDEHPCTDEPADDPMFVLIAALALQALNRQHAPVLAGVPSGWRNNSAVDRFVDLATRHGDRRVTYRLGRDPSFAVDADAVDVTVHDVTVHDVTDTRVAVTFDGVRHDYAVSIVGEDVFVDGDRGSAAIRRLPRFPMPDEAGLAGSLVAPMPGAIVRVLVAPGDTVTAGQPLVSLEAMKMEHQVLSPDDGIVAEILVSPGDQVDTGQTLLRVDPVDSTDHGSAAGTLSS